MNLKTQIKDLNAVLEELRELDCDVAEDLARIGQTRDLRQMIKELKALIRRLK